MVQGNIDTLEKMLKYMSQTHTTKKCLGTRDVLSEEDELQENGRVFKKFKMGDYQWRNFTEVEQEAVHFGNGIRKLGIRPKDNVVIFSETRAEWMIAAHGLFKHSCTIVTIYATLGEEGIIHGKRFVRRKKFDFAPFQVNFHIHSIARLFYYRCK
jgi:long-chain acyl-CoA synthetase